MEFDKKILLQNISYLLKKKKMKIGDLEARIGVSTGYISRISKKNTGVAAGIDIIKRIADVLEVSVDVLISIDLSGINDNDLYLINFINSLEIKTEAREVFWEKIETHTISEYFTGETSPDDCLDMIRVAPGQHIPDYEFDSDYRVVHVYKSFFLEPFLVQNGDAHHIAMPWFKLKIDEKNTVCLTYMYLYINECDYEEIMELYIDTAEYYEEEYDDGSSYSGYNHTCTPICCSETMGENIYNAINSLYRRVYDHQHDIRINNEVKNALDGFMKKK